MNYRGMKFEFSRRREGRERSGSMAPRNGREAHGAVRYARQNCVGWRPHWRRGTAEQPEPEFQSTAGNDSALQRSDRDLSPRRCPSWPSWRSGACHGGGSRRVTALCRLRASAAQWAPARRARQSQWTKPAASVTDGTGRGLTRSRVPSRSGIIGSLQQYLS